MADYDRGRGGAGLTVRQRGARPRLSTTGPGEFAPFVLLQTWLLRTWRYRKNSASHLHVQDIGVNRDSQRAPSRESEACERVSLEARARDPSIAFHHTVDRRPWKAKHVARFASRNADRIFRPLNSRWHNPVRGIPRRTKPKRSFHRFSLIRRYIERSNEILDVLNAICCDLRFAYWMHLCRIFFSLNIQPSLASLIMRKTAGTSSTLPSGKDRLGINWRIRH